MPQNRKPYVMILRMASIKNTQLSIVSIIESTVTRVLSGFLKGFSMANVMLEITIIAIIKFSKIELCTILAITRRILLVFEKINRDLPL